ncbi:transmembrane and coiled-coil domains protein 1-like isoform X2 [Etheostoma cragini]|uniref:transmembrane and coiled-coil domains protein 1-like isoform X2 n=1 Tax=Etheostoma cragini TaxID=417921 RepID=UPI00155F2365|nr:transmembrane and coiled-coil domains protein 1-like isoform X2 [Etheostoma cragini]
MFGSSDNIAALKDFETQIDEGVGPGETRVLRTRIPSSRDNTPDHAQASRYNTILHEIQELKENKGQLEECLENLKSCHQRNYTMIVEAIQEERYRSGSLEEQLNDLTELHQNEISNLKEELASMEEKTVYHSNKGATDIHEALKTCQTRLFKMEHQQQVVQLEGLENATTWTLLGKLINVLLAFMAVILVFVSTVANCVIPLMKTYSRMLSTLLFVVLFFFLWGHWNAISEYPAYFVCTHLERKNKST